MKHISSDLLKNTSLYRKINYIEKRFPNIKIYGKCEQATTSGKNLFDTRKTTTTSYGVTFTPNDDGSITIRGTSTADLNVTLVNSSNPPILSAGAYKKSIKVVGTITKNGNYVFLTGRDNYNSNVLKDTDIISNMTTSNSATLEEEHRMTGVGIWSNAAGVVFDCTIYIQIESGSTATEWEQYTGGIPAPNVNYPMNVETNVIGILEICKISTYKDYVYKTNGNWFKHKEIGKINSYNGETIESDYMSTTGGLDTGATIYYVLSSSVEEKITDITTINALEEIYANEIRKREEEIIVDEDIS